MSHKIILIDTLAQWNKVYSQICEESIHTSSPVIHVVGFDCEFVSHTTYPSSFAESKKWVLTINNEHKVAVCKLQLCTKVTSYVIDLCQLGPILPKTLVEILVDESWMKCGVGATNDMKYLSLNYNLSQCGGVFELRNLAIFAGCLNPSLMNIYSKLYNVKTSKKKQKNNNDWSKPMTMEQLKYAANDAYYSYKIGVHILDNLKILYNAILSKDEKEDTLSSSSDEDELIVKKTNEPIIITINNNDVNSVGLLQEYAQQNNMPLPCYDEIKSKDIDKFCIKCIMKDKNNTVICSEFGFDKTKKGAKKKSATHVARKLKLM
jgi:hypothetical protein